MLTHSPADIIRYALIQAGLGTLPTANGSWPITALQEVDSPDDAITCYDTTAKLDGRIMKTGEQCQHEGVQIRVRSSSPLDGGTKIRTIQNWVDQIVRYTRVVIATSTYQIEAINRPGSYLTLGTDAPVSKRALFTLNILVSITQLS